MRWLEYPFDEDCGALSARVFGECVNGFKSGNPKRQIASYRQLVAAASEEYHEKIPDDIEGYPSQESISKSDRKSLCAVYGEKFARVDSPGRKYYDALMSIAPKGRCPICGLRSVSVLDHYLPKSTYPLLAVTPANLFPMCSCCNGLDGKANYCGDTFEEMPIHLYFEEKPDYIWLKALFCNGESMRLEYGCGSIDDDQLRKRLDLHLRLFKLNEAYELQAVAHIENMRYRWACVLRESGRKGLLSVFVEERTSTEYVDKNSWMSAMYRALVEQIDDFIEYLELSSSV